MKKIAMLFAAALIAVSASAQKTTITGQKWSDNIYIGGAAGIETSLMGENKAMSAFNPNFSVMVGKNFNPVFGLRIEAVTRFNAHTNNCKYGYGQNHTFVNGLDLNLLSTWNLMNLFAGYKGDPRTFEITALFGLGWGHGFGVDLPRYNTINSKVGLDFAYNFGKDKQFQIFIEPSLTYAMQTYVAGTTLGSANCVGYGAIYPYGYGNNIFQYDARNATLDLKAGFVYKFPCSNGKHNFAIEQLRDQAEIDGLNAKINSLRGDVDAANAKATAEAAKVAKLQKDLAACQNKPVTKEKKAANLQPSVIFRQGKSVVDKSQMANVEMIANYMKHNPSAKVKISGYASPEGSKEINEKLSVARAAAVKDVLVKKYKIAADRLETEGLGATDKLFQEVEFNRVALFNDTTK